MKSWLIHRPTHPTRSSSLARAVSSVQFENLGGQDEVQPLYSTAGHPSIQQPETAQVHGFSGIIATLEFKMSWLVRWGHLAIAVSMEYSDQSREPLSMRNTLPPLAPVCSLLFWTSLLSSSRHDFPLRMIFFFLFINGWEEKQRKKRRTCSNVAHVIWNISLCQGCLDDYDHSEDFRVIKK